MTDAEPLVSTTFGLRQLRYFVVAAEEGQITRAAQKLNLAQPALSRTIAQLEAQMGVKLLQRHARGVSLTPAGEELLEKAQAVLDAIGEVERMSQSLSRATRGAAEVGFLGASPMIDAPELFTTFSTEYPEFHLSFHQLPFPHGSTAEWVADADPAVLSLVWRTGSESLLTEALVATARQLHEAGGGGIGSGVEARPKSSPDEGRMHSGNQIGRSRAHPQGGRLTS